MKNIVLDGWIRFGKFFIVNACTKNYLHLAIESAPLQSDPTVVITHQLSVDSKAMMAFEREIEQQVQQEQLSVDVERDGAAGVNKINASKNLCVGIPAVVW